MRKLLSIFTFCGFVFFSSAARSTQEFKVDGHAIEYGYISAKLWLQNYDTPIVKLVQPVYADIDELPVGAEAKPATEFDIVLGKERKRPFAFVLVPVYRKDEETGRYQQLVSYSLNVEERSVPMRQPALKTTATSSVLSTGDWYKIAVRERGVYKIDHDFIKNKLNINPSSLNPAHIRLYGNGGTMLSESNAVSRPDDLVENAIVVSDGGDGKFDPGDFILFYANGPMAWTPDADKKRFHHLKNLYEDSSYYFLNFDLGEGLRVGQQSNPPAGNVTVTTYNDYMVHEEDLINVGKFGKLWWGEEFSTEPGKQSSRSFSFNTGATVDSAFVRMGLSARSLTPASQFRVQLNGETIGVYGLGAVSGVAEDAVTRNVWPELSVAAPSGTATFQIDFTPSSATSRGYLDYIELNTRRALAFHSGQFTFRDLNSVGAGNIATYKIQGANNKVVVWDITDPLRPVRMSGTLSGGEYSFTRDAAELHEFVAFDGSVFHTPTFIKKIANQNLHGSEQADYIIVTHSNFLDAANKLADFHRTKSQLRVIVATTEQVYNEFGSGSQDISAIRDFVRMFYERAGTDSMEMPKYLLLFGDASYDYKYRTSNNTNFVPTYETLESTDGLTSYCSDDFFAFLDDNEDIENWPVANTMDLGVGRLPVTSASDADKLVDKIMSYYSPASLGPWRLSTTVVADNEDYGSEIHFEDGEIMAKTISKESPLYNHTKVYLSAIPTVPTPGGARAPEANKAINDAVFKGTFLINYNGHGSITTLAHERILTQDDFNSWKNKDKLPIIITATCEFSKYDDPAYVSAGEKLILKSDGGAIALLTTTQLVFQHLNRPMNMGYLTMQFQKQFDRWLTLGEAFRYSKNLTYSKPNQLASTLANFRKFALLGDPALQAAFPKYNIQTESVLEGTTMQPSDTLSALGKHQINGSVRDEQGQILSDFNGRVYITIYDKPKQQQTLGTTAKIFTVQNNVIYKGRATVTNGLFSFTFVAPKDLNYDFGRGKISYYAENGETDAAGVDSNIVIGGFSDNPVEDDDAPVVRAFMNDSLFVDGGITGSNTLLYAQLFDETGINVSGNGIGHDLIAILDEDIDRPFVLNDYYETDANDYTRGFVNFPISGLADGRHSLRVKAWDMNNNSGEGVVNFVVLNGRVVSIQNLMNYPNPFRDETHFVFEHNHPEENLNVQINIYSTSGYLVRTLRQDFFATGSRSNEIVWDGTDNNGAKLPSGIYVYRINVSTASGIQATGYQKLVLIR